VVASFVWLLIGYRHLAGSLYPPAQIAYLISSGLGPLGCLLAGLAVVLRADLRDEQHKLCQIEWALTGDTQSEVEGRLVLRPGGTVALLVLAVVVEGLGWARAAHALEADRAMEGLDVAVAGLGAAFLVVGVATISVRRRFVDHAAQVLARLRETDASGHPMRAGTSVPGYWTVAGLRRYHRVLCPALTSARGELQPVSDRAPGLEPCLLCDAGE
jgi:hypothetical protein